MADFLCDIADKRLIFCFFYFVGQVHNKMKVGKKF